MKRLTLFILLLQGAALIFAQNPEAFIREMTGTVELKAPGASNWVPAKTGDRIQMASFISTGIKSIAVLAVGNSTITVRPFTNLSLESLIEQDNTEKVSLELRTGRIKADVNPPAGKKADFSIRTPMITASVRGTSFDLDPINLRVQEGRVRYESMSKTKGQAVLVNAGQSSWFDPGSERTVNPLAASESSRSLPSLPGQGAASSGTGQSGIKGLPVGNLGVGVNLSGGKGSLEVEVELKSN